MLILKGAPGHPLLADDGRIDVVVQAHRESGPVRGVQRDEGVAPLRVSTSVENGNTSDTEMSLGDKT